MRIMITGSGGQIGQNLVKFGDHYGHEILTADSKDIDVRDLGALQRVMMAHKPQLVINAAAYTNMDEAESQPDLAYEINEVGPRNLASICADMKIPLIQISNVEVFDGTSEHPYLEEDIASPISVFGSSRLAGEEAIRRALDKHLILRVGWLFCTSNKNFVTEVVNAAQNDAPVYIHDGLTGNPTCAACLARAIYKIIGQYADEKTLPWGTYHYAHDPAIGRVQFAEQILQHAQKLGKAPAEATIQSIRRPAQTPKARRPANSQLATSKFKATFNIEPKDWHECLDATLERLSG
jgi:dTDP-4-dehydrorhamnose reductase